VIQQPIEMMMQSSDRNNKLIALPKSIEVHSILKVNKTPMSKENQMSGENATIFYSVAGQHSITN
jgi:hypothetical protein